MAEGRLGFKFVDIRVSQSSSIFFFLHGIAGANTSGRAK
jgi:hypothetical protein